MNTILRGVSAACCVLFFAAIAISAAGQDAQSPQQHQAQARKMVQDVLSHWDWTTWDELLAEDVTLTIKLGAVMPDQRGQLAAIGLKSNYSGRDEAKSALKEIYGDLKKRFVVETDVVSGNKALFLGDLNVSHGQQTSVQPIPLAVYLEFNDNRKIEQITLATVDLRPLAKTAVSQASER